MLESYGNCKFYIDFIIIYNIYCVFKSSGWIVLLIDEKIKLIY